MISKIKSLRAFEVWIRLRIKTSWLLNTIVCKWGMLILRAHNPKDLEKLTTSIEYYGQLIPVVVVPEKKQWVLIDGYQRVKALKRLGKD